MTNRGSTWRQAGFVGLYLGAVIVLGLPARIRAQATATVSQNPVNPLGLPIRFGNYPRPIHYGVTQPPLKRSEREKILAETEAPNLEEEEIVCPWSLTLSGSYLFSNDRSRVADVSLDGESAMIDLTAADNKWPYTCLDISYTYSYASGSSPADTTQTGNQHVGSLRLLQPIHFFGETKKPATLNIDKITNQLAVILDGNYGGSLTSTRIPRSPSISSTAYTFLGNALLDYQFGWFPYHEPNKFNTPKPQDNYPSLLLEFSSGVQFNAIRLHSSSRVSTMTSSGRQLTYQNIASLTYSFPDRLGILVAAEWDAPLYSDPLRGSQPYYANIAVFTAGLTYNYYLGKQTQKGDSGKTPWNLSRWSLSLLYSYIAFDPLTETNQLQVQVSYGF